ncbi:DUF397 domain-containing protein [Streptomyces sp. NBC_00102]|uniref:DUF397 domain-containing protein n=1 Tax=Streptomyces sp. NBC_00102 TaxID=2975652 RepID=UPI002258A9F5|nr:DUF397 domain-containing protein [Streptomyces sp. NBC_00102]MCX5398929.1 DUF397 domain-containing protein [Streptomyces sp. NBC_00102]
MSRTPDFNCTRWRKSTYSDGGANNCLEIADDCPGFAPVRDSKNPTGPTLLIAAPAWTAFINDVRTTDR